MKSWKKYYKEYLKIGYPKDKAYKMARLDDTYNKKMKKMRE